MNSECAFAHHLPPTISCRIITSEMTGAGGYVHVVCGRQKTWQLDVKMNCPCNAVSFLDEDTLTTSGQGKGPVHC